MSAYCVRNPDSSWTCYPYWVPSPGVGAGGAMWCPSATPGFYPIGTMTCNTADGRIIPPPSSGGASSGNQAPTQGGAIPLYRAPVPSSPVTGPGRNEPQPQPEETPPPEACGPAMIRPSDDDRTTSSRYGGDSLEERLSVPTVGASSYLNQYGGTGFDDEPVVTQKLKIKKRGNKIDVYHRPTGPGILAFHVAELQDYHLYGQDNRPNSSWPQNLSANTVLIHNQERSDGNSSYSNAKTILAIGGALLDTIKPSSGAYFDLDFTTGYLCINPTDSTGADDSTKGIKSGGAIVISATTLPVSGSYAGEMRIDSGASNALKWWDGSVWQTVVSSGGGFGWPLLAPDGTATPQYSFNEATVPTSNASGMYFDQDTQEGPGFKSIDGTAQMIVSNTGVEIPNKLTVGGLIDPTGIIFTEQSTAPWTGSATLGGLWVKNEAQQSLVFNDDNDVDYRVMMIPDSITMGDNEIPRTDSAGRGRNQNSNLRIRDAGTYYTDDATIEAFGGSKGRNIGIRGGLWSGSSANAGDVYIDGGAHTFAGLTGSRSGDVHINAGTVSSASRGSVYLSDLVAGPVQIGSASIASHLQIYERASAPGNTAGLVKLFTINSAPNTLEAIDDQGGVSYLHARHNINRAYRNTSVQSLTYGTWTKVQLNAESFDLESTFDSSTNYRFTPNVAGYYQINWNVEFALDNDGALSPYDSTATRGQVYKSAIYKNGSKYSGGSTDSFNPMGYEGGLDEFPESHGSDIVYLNGSTDYIELYAIGYNQSGWTPTVRNGEDATYMSATLINKK